jgi:murein DD-endopeptidase MepM/ murein hydrolase activator NlpD
MISICEQRPKINIQKFTSQAFLIMNKPQKKNMPWNNPLPYMLALLMLLALGPQKENPVRIKEILETLVNKDQPQRTNNWDNGEKMLFEREIYEDAIYGGPIPVDNISPRYDNNIILASFMIQPLDPQNNPFENTTKYRFPMYSDNPTIISDINDCRSHWYHQWIDFDGQHGSTVYGIPGEIVRIAPDGSGLQCVTIESQMEGEKIEIKYMHIKANTNLQVGQEIDYRSPIGTIEKIPTENNTLVNPDWTKNQTHLHIEAKRNGKRIDPKKIFELPDNLKIYTQCAWKIEEKSQESETNASNQEQQHKSPNILYFDEKVEIWDYIDKLIDQNTNKFDPQVSIWKKEIWEYARQHLYQINWIQTNSIDWKIKKKYFTQIDMWILATLISLKFDQFTTSIGFTESSGEYDADNYPTLLNKISTGEIVIVENRKEKWNKNGVLYMMESDIYTQSAIGKYQMIRSFILQYGKWLWPNQENLDIAIYDQDVSWLSDKNKKQHIIGFNERIRNYILQNPDIQDKMMQRSFANKLFFILDWLSTSHPHMNSRDIYSLIALAHFSGDKTLKMLIHTIKEDDPEKMRKIMYISDRLGTTVEEYIQKIMQNMQEDENLEISLPESDIPVVVTEEK